MYMMFCPGMSGVRSCLRCCSSPMTSTSRAGRTPTWWDSSTRCIGNNKKSGLGICSLVFRAHCSFFSEQKNEIAICSFPRANCSRRSFLKGDRSELLMVTLYGERFALGIKRGKAVKNFQKLRWKLRIFSSKLLVFLWAKEWKCNSLSKKQANHHITLL